MLARPILPLMMLASLLAACTQQSEEPANDSANVTGNVAILPSLPVPIAMDRAGMLAAVAQAASAAAGGLDDGEAQRKLDGRQFEVRLRFGCSGPAEVAEAEAMSWRFDETKRTLRLRAAPDISADQPLPASIAGDGFEAVEGFWIPRPWLLQPGCPVVPSTLADPATDSAERALTRTAPKEKPPAETDLAKLGPESIAQHRVGIAQFFTDTDSRTLRRDGRPYEATKALAEGQAPSAQGYDLVLSGRLKRLPDGRVIACKVEQANRPPQCLVSAAFDRVWIERPDTQETLAEWNAGG